MLVLQLNRLFIAKEHTYPIILILMGKEIDPFAYMGKKRKCIFVLHIRKKGIKENKR